MKTQLLGLLLLSAIPMSYAIECPCPGPCCPKLAESSFMTIADYLSPWDNSEATMEKDLQIHRI